jgi:hypothetical protein
MTASMTFRVPHTPSLSVTLERTAARRLDGELTLTIGETAQRIAALRCVLDLCSIQEDPQQRTWLHLGSLALEVHPEDALRAGPLLQLPREYVAMAPA